MQPRWGWVRDERLPRAARSPQPWAVGFFPFGETSEEFCPAGQHPKQALCSCHSDVTPERRARGEMGSQRLGATSGSFAQKRDAESGFPCEGGLTPVAGVEVGDLQDNSEAHVQQIQSTTQGCGTEPSGELLRGGGHLRGLRCDSGEAAFADVRVDQCPGFFTLLFRELLAPVKNPQGVSDFHRRQKRQRKKAGPLDPLGRFRRPRLSKPALHPPARSHGPVVPALAATQRIRLSLFRPASIRDPRAPRARKWSPTHAACRVRGRSLQQSRSDSGTARRPPSPCRRPRS